MASKPRKAKQAETPEILPENPEVTPEVAPEVEEVSQPEPTSGPVMDEVFGLKRVTY